MGKYAREFLRKFINCRRGSIIENIIYIIIIGALTFTFYTDFVAEPLAGSMNDLTTNIDTWTKAPAITPAKSN